MVLGFKRANLKSFLSRPPVAFALLLGAAVIALLGVNHLVKRFREQEKALGRRLYMQGQTENSSGGPERAIEDFRAALTYDHDNFQYQLGLARALRDSGRTDESKTYLVNLWERNPEDGTVNLALGRLAARENIVDEAIHYYHNATYGIWDSDAETRRRNAEFELINFLLQQKAFARADGELVTLAPSLPVDSEVEMQAAKMFSEAGDQGRALAEYSAVTQHDRRNAAAFAGGGHAAFDLHRYRTAEKYWSEAAGLDPRNDEWRLSLASVRMILLVDPSLRGLSNVERTRRIREAFKRSGEVLLQCANLRDTSIRKESEVGNPGFEQDENEKKFSSAEFMALRESWYAMKPRIARRKGTIDLGTGDTAMALAFRIEAQAQGQCGNSTAIDQALLQLGKNPQGADQ